MAAAPNAVELTVDQAWFIAETVGAGTFPWVLAITTPYTDAGERGAFIDRQAAELTRLGMMAASGDVNPAVADWIRQVCFPDRWLDLRYVGSGQTSGADELLRGIIARRGGQTQKTIVALRNAQLVTFTAMDIHDARALVPVRGGGWARGPTSGCATVARAPKSLTTWASRSQHVRWWSRCSAGHAATLRSSRAAATTDSTPAPRLA